jgi:hypothetical protein
MLERNLVLDRCQIGRLRFAGKSESTVEKTLGALRKEGLITARPWSIRDAQRQVTVPQLARWSLTPAGHTLIKQSDQYPAKPARPRQKRLIPHDLRTAEAIVRLIELARPAGLSGLFVTHEVRLDPQHTRLVCDAVVIMQLGQFAHPHLVPWSNDPAIEDETRYRYAIEADNDTEPSAVIRGKGHAYAGVHSDPVWQDWWWTQYGPPPRPLWIVPTAVRLQVVQQQWQRAWPHGVWLITDDAGLARNRWRAWDAGHE